MVKEAGLPAEVPMSGTEAGQTFIEILLAFSIAMIVLSAIVVGINSSLSNTQHTKNQNLANSYAQEGMAVVRQIKDSDWNNFAGMSLPMYCIDQGSSILRDSSSGQGCDSSLLLSCGQNVNIFMREVKLGHSDISCNSGSKVTVRVCWSDSKCPIGTPYCHKTELISCFGNIGGKQEP